MKKAIVIQVAIFIGAWFAMIPDTIEDNTYLFGLIGSYDLVRGNAHWVLAGAAILSIINIWFWWPKIKVTSTSETAKESKESAEAKKIDQDPKTPTLD